MKVWTSLVHMCCCYMYIDCVHLPTAAKSPNLGKQVTVDTRVISQHWLCCTRAHVILSQGHSPNDNIDSRPRATELVLTDYLCIN